MSSGYGAEYGINSISIDSRSIDAGQTFLALKGEQFDGHEYLHAAYKKGAAALVTEQVFAGSAPQWVVQNSLKSLGFMAYENRQNFSGRLIGLTGSNGKTTVKEMLVTILSISSEVHATRGNLNNSHRFALDFVGSG